MATTAALFSFAFHADPWLETIAKDLKREPWGKDNKVLELYLKATFELAKQQNKVYEDEQNGLAFWKAGYLVNEMSDPVWLIYQLNKKADKQKWVFKKVHSGNCPVQGRETSEFQISITPPEFNPTWSIHISQTNIDHIYRDPENVKRLELVFGEALAKNSHLIFRTILGEIELNRKSETVIPQWYFGDYQFLMPLFLTQSDKVELAATLTPNPTMKRYEIRTLLLPHYSYAYARALVKNRAAFASWMLLSDADLNSIYADTEDE
jgi:hypothetical protein